MQFASESVYCSVSSTCYVESSQASLRWQTTSYASLKTYNVRTDSTIHDDSSLLTLLSHAAQWASYVGLVCEMVSDAIIATYMVLLLRSRRNDVFERYDKYWRFPSMNEFTNSTLGRTRSIVDALITYTVGTCILTVYVILDVGSPRY